MGTEPYMREMGHRPLPVSPLEGVKDLFLIAIFSVTAKISPPFFRCYVPLWGLYTAPLEFGGLDPHFGGKVPPTENLRQGTLVFFERYDFHLNSLIAKGRAPISTEEFLER